MALLNADSFPTLCSHDTRTHVLMSDQFVSYALFAFMRVFLGKGDHKGEREAG